MTEFDPERYRCPRCRDKAVIDQAALEEAIKNLKEYLGEFPEHEQGDIRVFAAYEILMKANGRP